MRKSLFLMPLIAAMAFTSCSSDEPIGDGQTTKPNDSEDTGNTSYVSIAIASNNASGSRADYTDGAGDEAKVKNVVLFFYDEAGQPLNVNVGTTNANYKIIENPTLEGHTEAVGSEFNVEHWFKQTQQLHTRANVTTAKVLAWVNVNIGEDENDYKVLRNYTNQAEVAGNISMRGLGEVSYFTGRTFTGPTGTANPEFVMTSSTYLNEANDKVMREVEVKVFSTKEEAEKPENVATIYVERVKARVNLTDGSNKDAQGFYKPDLTDVTFPPEVTPANLKLKVLGWTLNTVCKNVYFFKQLDAKNYGFDWTWNDPAHHRSYWENGFNIEGNRAVDGNYFENVAFTPSTIKTLPGAGYEYLNPNTTVHPTYALVCTQLVDASDNPVSIAKWYGSDYMASELPAAVLSTLPKGKVYVEDKTKAPASYIEISKEHITFEQGNGTPGTSESWRAYPVLAKQIDNVDVQYYEYVDLATSKVWQPITYDKANALLGFYKSETDKSYNTEGAKIWTKGLAYYFVPIKHFGKDNNNANRTTGVVRNHSYNIEIEGFKGLGTPIYEPDQVIPEPDLPEDDKETYVSVKMDVLSWRIVPKQSVIFGGE